MNRPVSSEFANWRLSAWLGSYLACRSNDSCRGAHRDWLWSLCQRSGSPVSFPMQWSQVVWCKVSACNGCETISSLVELSVEEGTCTGPRCCDPAWGRRPDGREREPHDRTVCRPFAWHAGGTPKRKQGTERLSQLFHMLQVYVWDSVLCDLKVWFNFSPNRMDPDFAKRLFRRTHDSWCESSHNYFPLWNFPNLEQPGKQQKEDILNSVDWPQAFYKEQKFLSIFSRVNMQLSRNKPSWPMHRTCTIGRNSPAGSCVSIVLQASYQGVAGVENPWKRSRRTCERSVKFSHCWREYQHFLGGIGQENVQKMLSFSDMLFTKHWKQIPKKLFWKKRKLRPKTFAPTLSKMTGRKWSDIAQFPKWPLCGHRDVNSQWAYSTVSAIFPLTSLLPLCTGPGTHCHHKSLLLSRSRSRNRWSATCVGFVNCFSSLFSSVRMAVIDWWNGPLTLVVTFFALCLLPLTWSIASVACRACHLSGTFFPLWHTHTHTNAHARVYTHYECGF